MHNNSHTHGSHESWEEVYKDLDLSYSEETDTQGKLFEIVKVEFLKELFPKKAKMLEVGCGSAFVSLYFTKRGFQVSCLDINKFILEVAKKNFKKERVKGEFVVGDAEKLPFKSQEFDIVTSFGLLEHFENPKNAISEMVRVLKPNGILFADIVPNRFSVQSIGNVFNGLAVFSFWSLKGKIGIGLKKAINNFRPQYFENSISWQDYKKIMEKVGLGNVEVRGNRPYPRLTLPKSLDSLYASILKPTIFLWKLFDRLDNPLSKVWGAGLWFWGYKSG